MDPSHYISRFAALLEFGDETPKVAADAVRLVARMDRDWMRSGRRPAGICGACLLLAARMNNFRRSVQEIVQVVKIADTTLKKRLDEFRRTPSGALTLADFRTVWLEDEMDPPAYTKGKEKEARERDKDIGVDVEENPMVESRLEYKRHKTKKRKKEEEVDHEDLLDRPEEPAELPNVEPPIDPQLLREGILAGIPDLPLFLPNNVAAESAPAQDPEVSAVSKQSHLPVEEEEGEEGVAALDEAVTAVLRDEVNVFLTNQQSSQLAGALEEAEIRRHAEFTGDDELLGLDETELDAFILTDEEVKVKERVWVEINRDYLEALAGMYDIFWMRAFAQWKSCAVKEALKEGTAEPKSRKVRILQMSFFLSHFNLPSSTTEKTKNKT